MIYVRKLPPQANAILLKQEKWAPDSYLNPVQDADGNWIISEEEYQGMEEGLKNKFPFFNNLEQIEYKEIQRDPYPGEF